MFGCWKKRHVITSGCLGVHRDTSSGTCGHANTLDGLSLADIEIESVVGMGGFGKVYKGSFNGATVAVKMIEHDRTVMGAQGEPLEALLCKGLDHPNVVRTYLNQTRHRDSIHGSLSSRSDVFSARSSAWHDFREFSGLRSELSDTDDFSYLARNLRGTGETGRGAYRTWIVMEFCDKGPLHCAIKEGLFFIDKQKRHPRFSSIILTALDVARALTYLHDRKIIHGDLKAQNVLLKSDPDDRRGFSCKVADFGLSRMITTNSHIQTFTFGTVRYMAPELLKNGLLTPAADIYSFGMLVWELVVGRAPYPKKCHNDIIVDVVDGKRPTIPAHCPSDIIALIQDCWHQDRTMRPSFSQVGDRLEVLWRNYDAIPNDPRVEVRVGNEQNLKTFGVLPLTDTRTGERHPDLHIVACEDRAILPVQYPIEGELVRSRFPLFLSRLHKLMNKKITIYSMDCQGIASHLMLDDTCRNTMAIDHTFL